MIPIMPLNFELVKAEAERERDDARRGRWILAIRDCCRGLRYRLGLVGEGRPVCCAGSPA